MFLFNLPRTRRVQYSGIFQELSLGRRFSLWEEISDYFSLCSVDIDYTTKAFTEREARGEMKVGRKNKEGNLLRYNLIIIRFCLVTGNEFAFLFPPSIQCSCQRFIFIEKFVFAFDTRECLSIVFMHSSEKSTLMESME